MGQGGGAKQTKTVQANAVDSEVKHSTVPDREMLTAEVINRAKGSLFGLFIADALGMPAHWYYSVGDLQRHYGKITDFVAPKEPHPGSIMSLSSTGGGGRGGQRGSIIGDVINHGKKHLWGQRGIHYHHGMRAGENTLNALCARVVMRSIAAAGTFDPQHSLNAYVKFMTTPGSHNDTYAETYHRMFFSNWHRGVKPEQCADNDGHNTDSVGGMVALPPVATWAALTGQSAEEAGKAAAAQVALTHRSDTLQKYAILYGRMIANLIRGADLRQEVQEAARAVGFGKIASYIGLEDTQVVGGMLSPACYIDDSFKTVLYFAYKYHDRPEEGLIGNVNCGGENVHRGATLGALLGAANGLNKWPERWVKGLAESGAIQSEVDKLIETAMPAGTLKSEL